MRAVTIILLAIGGIAAGQELGPSFEVATVKRPDPSAPVRARMSTRGGPGTDQLTHFECRGCPLALLIAKAYDLSLYQVSGPDWLMEDLFDVNAKLPEDTSIEQFHMMLQSLLADRFRLKSRREARESPGYELSVGPGGSKLKEAGPPGDPAETYVPLKPDRDGFPILPPGQGIAALGDHYRRHSQETIGDLTRFLTLWLSKPVVDRTGLIGRYDITLSFVMPRPAQGQADGQEFLGATLVDAVRETGLRLVSKKVQVDYIVVESAQRIPTDN